MDPAAAAWAASGAATLSGRDGGPPLGPPRGLVELVERAAAVLGVDGLALLGERAALAGLGRRGAVSCGGSTRLLPAADGWLAVALARPEDVAALPAWLERPVPAGDPWATITPAVAECAAAGLDERAALLGLPIAAVGSATPTPAGLDGLPVTVTAYGPVTHREQPLIVDLAALWAGPLCAQLLARPGARVVKVESPARPDGLRRDPSGLYDVLNARKEAVALDLTTQAGVADLRRLLVAADVVVEGSRPRALEQIGIVAAEVLAADTGPAVWVSITGFGRAPDARHRVAFGDVAAAAGGLLTADGDGPCFCADAVADPLAGLVAAAAATAARAGGTRVLLDVAMAGVAAAAATGDPVPLDGLDLAPPRARAATGAVRPTGADTEAVLGALPR